MMHMKKLFWVAVVVLAAGCKKEETDDKPPTIEIVSAPAPDSVILAEQNFKVRYRAEDNRGLSRTEGRVVPENPTMSNPFSIINQPLAGKSGEWEMTVAVPGTAQDGKYRLDVTVFDLKDNRQTAPSIAFNVLNPTDATPPQLNVELPLPDAVYTPGAPIRIKAVATDHNSKLRDLIVNLFTETGTQNLFSPQIYLSLNGTETYTLDTTVTLPGQLSPGMYRIGILAADTRINHTEVFRRIVVQ
jgi:hypothetical protein